MLTTNFHLTKSLTVAVLVLVSVTMASVFLTTPQQARAATADSMTFTSTGRTSAALDYAAATAATYHARHRDAGNNSWTSMGSATASAPGIVLNFTATGLEPNVSYDFEVSTDPNFPTENTDSATFSNRPDHLDLELASGNQNPRGMWSDGTTLWIANDEEGDNNRIYAYALPAGTYLPEKTFTLSALSHTAPGGVHGRGTTLWVTDTKTDRIIAYSIADDDTYSNHLQGQSFDTDPSEKLSSLTMPHGITSNDEKTTMWAVSYTDESLLAYDFRESTTLGTRESSKDCDLYTNYSSPAGAWHGNDDTIYVVDRLEKHIFAYDQDAEGCQDRRPLREIRLVGANAAPWGIWSDGDTMYAVDDEDDWIYAHYLPLRTKENITRATISHPDAGVVVLDFAFSNPDGDSKTLTLTYLKGASNVKATVTETTTEETATFALTSLDEGATYTGHVSLDDHRAPFGFRALSKDDQVERTLHSIVREREDDFPWIKATYNGIRRDNIPVYRSSHSRSAVSLVCDDHACDATGIFMHDEADHATYVHEMAHVWTESRGHADEPTHFMGIGWLYFVVLSYGSNNCPAIELYADAVTHVTEGLPDIVYGYYNDCMNVGTKPSDATNNIITDVMNGEYSPWFSDRYQSDGLPYRTSELEGVPEDYDLERIKADIVNWEDGVHRIVYDKLHTGFGGFCPRYDSETTRNPFRVGGCVPRAPTAAARHAGDSAVFLSWATPSYDGGSPITRYEYRQRPQDNGSGSKPFGPWIAIDNSGVGEANSNSYRVTNLDDGIRRQFQIRAVNDVDPGATSNIATPKGPPTVSITADVSQPATSPFRVTFTFTDQDSEGNEYDVVGFEPDDITAFFTRRGHPSYEFQLEDFRVETPNRVYSALVDEIIDGKLWVMVPANSARSVHDDQGNTSAFRTWQVDAPDPPPAPPSAEETNVWTDTLTVGGRETGIMGYFVAWSRHTDKDEQFGALPNAAFTYDGTEYEILELSYVGSWRVARLSMCPLLPGMEDASLRLGDRRFEFGDDSVSLRKFRRAKDGARQQCGEYDWEKTTLEWSYGDQVPGRHHTSTVDEAGEKRTSQHPQRKIAGQNTPQSKGRKPKNDNPGPHLRPQHLRS